MQLHIYFTSFGAKYSLFVMLNYFYHHRWCFTFCLFILFFYIHRCGIPHLAGTGRCQRTIRYLFARCSTWLIYVFSFFSIIHILSLLSLLLLSSSLFFDLLLLYSLLFFDRFSTPINITTFIVKGELLLLFIKRKQKIKTVSWPW